MPLSYRAMSRTLRDHGGVRSPRRACRRCRGRCRAGRGCPHDQFLYLVLNRLDGEVEPEGAGDLIGRRAVGFFRREHGQDLIGNACGVGCRRAVGMLCDGGTCLSSVATRAAAGSGCGRLRGPFAGLYVFGRINVRRHDWCADNVTIGAPIRARCVVRQGQRGDEMEAGSRSRRGGEGQKKGAGGGWRSERDICGAASVTLGATNVTPYSMSYGSIPIIFPLSLRFPGVVPTAWEEV